MAISRRSIAAIAALTLSIGAVVFAGAPAQANPTPVAGPTVAFSAPTIGFGQIVTYSVTTTSLVLICGYANDALSPDFIRFSPSDFTSIQYNDVFFSQVLPGATDLTLYVLDASAPVSCSAAKADAAALSLATASLTIGGAPTPAPTPTIDPTPVVPAPVEPALAVTGQDAAGPLGLVGMLLAAGFGALAVRRRTAKS